MILKMFSVYDTKAEAYHQPFCTTTQSLAIRSFMDTANDESTSIGKHPADFNLFYLGEYDDHTGSFNLEESKVNLGNALEFKDKEQL